MDFKDRITTLAKDLRPSAAEVQQQIFDAGVWLKAQGATPITIFSLMKHELLALCRTPYGAQCNICKLHGITDYASLNIPVIQSMNIHIINDSHGIQHLESSSSFYCLLCLHQISNTQIGLITGELAATLLEIETDNTFSKLIADFIDRRLAIATFNSAFAYDELFNLGIDNLDDVIMGHTQKMAHL